MIIPGVKRAKTKIQIQNTQIHHMLRCQKDPTFGIFLKRGLFKGIKNDNPMCQTCKNKKCKYTNKQIHHMVKCQKDPSCGIFYYAVGGWGPVFRTKSFFLHLPIDMTPFFRKRLSIKLLRCLRLWNDFKGGTVLY